jgi:predicted TIM-barrel fold metal-dependent hydrolase
MIDDRPFTPKQATADDCKTFMATIGVEHVCIIASSIYGRDNRCLVDSLNQFRGKARGIAYIDPETISDAEMDELDAAGVRGIRYNLWSRSQTLDPTAWEGILGKIADRLRRLDWSLQIFVSMDQIAAVAPVVKNLGIKVIFDHLGCPNKGEKPVAEQPGCSELYSLLKDNNKVYIKMSGAYRFEGVLGLEDHMRHLLRLAPNQIVWASDWPHTGGKWNNPGGDHHREQEFLKPDIPGFLKQCLSLCDEDEALIRKIWVDNPRRLWDYSPDE